MVQAVAVDYMSLHSWRTAAYVDVGFGYPSFD